MAGAASRAWCGRLGWARRPAASRVHAAESLALGWRRRLTRHLHERYCGRQAAFYFLCTPGGGGKGGAAPEGLAPPAQQHDVPQQEGMRQEGMRQGSQVDNPDQRIAADAAELCEALSALTKVAAAAPFKLLYYSALTWGYLGWRGVVTVYAFFWAAALAQR